MVVLTRLSENQMKTFCPPTPLDDHSENESSINSDCDELWEPKQKSDDSDSSFSSNKTASKRRRKGDHKNQKRFQSKIKSEHGRITAATSNEGKISTPQASANTDDKTAAMNTSTQPAKTEGNGHKNIKIPTTEDVAIIE